MLEQSGEREKGEQIEKNLRLERWGGGEWIDWKAPSMYKVLIKF